MQKHAPEPHGCHCNNNVSRKLWFKLTLKWFSSRWSQTMCMLKEKKRHFSKSMTSVLQNSQKVVDIPKCSLLKCCQKVFRERSINNVKNSLLQSTPCAYVCCSSSGYTCWQSAFNIVEEFDCTTGTLHKPAHGKCSSTRAFIINNGLQSSPLMNYSCPSVGIQRSGKA